MGRLTALLLVGALVLGACGDDGGDDVSTDGDGGSSTEVTFDDLVGKAFASTNVTGHELVEGTTLDLTFIDGRVSAIAGCNTQNGDADVVDGTLEVSALASTMMGCEEALMDQDVWVAGFLESGPEITLDGDVLTLTSGDESVELTAQS
jgi:heat shock protein HslJ